MNSHAGFLLLLLLFCLFVCFLLFFEERLTRALLKLRKAATVKGRINENSQRREDSVEAFHKQRGRERIKMAGFRG